MTGYVDTSSKEIGVSVSVLGIDLGAFSGSFDSGIGIDVNLFLVKGKLNFVVEDSTLYFIYDVKVLPFSHYTGKEKVISF